MSKIDVLDREGNVVGDVDLDEDIFDIEPNEVVVHEAVVQYLANQRQGTRGSKTRSEVRGGGRKPWRQKGTGRARAGTSRSPLWRGGGIIFAPKARDYHKKMNRKAKNLALRSVFSDKKQNDALVVIDKLEFEEPKTKEMIKVLDAIEAPKSLIVTPIKDKNVYYSSHNIPNSKATTVEELNVYDMLYYENLVLTRDALEKIQEVYAK